MASFVSFTDMVRGANWPGRFTTWAGIKTSKQVSLVDSRLFCVHGDRQTARPRRLASRESLPSSSITARQVTCCAEHFQYLTSLNAGTQYNAFGEDVQNLKSNLDAIIDVVQNASQQTSRNERRRDANNWDLSSIKEIVGDYERTLNDSKQLLHENRQFSRGKNPLVNIEWNIVVMPTVTRLRERISFHNSKVSGSFSFELSEFAHSPIVSQYRLTKPSRSPSY